MLMRNMEENTRFRPTAVYSMYCILHSANSLRASLETLRILTCLYETSADRNPCVDTSAAAHHAPCRAFNYNSNH